MDSMFKPEMKPRFIRDGYLAVENVFSETDLIPIRQRVDALIADPEHPPEGVKVSREGNTAADKNSTEALNDDVRPNVTHTS